VWGDRFRTAADLALAGTVVTLAALPVVTAGAAFAAGSYAMAHFVAYETWPAPRACFEVFRRRLRPGLPAGPAVAAAMGLVWLDVRALHTGAVPGGVPVIAAVLLAAAVGAGLVGLAVVRVGVAAAAARGVVAPGSVSGGVGNRTGVVAAATGVLGLIAVLGLLVHPVLLPALAGYALFALHVVARRPAPGRALPGEAPQDVVGAGAGHPEHEPAGQREYLVDR
jgi:hypothetical protein